MNIASLQRYLEQLQERFAALESGSVADYIPELRKANPDWFGIALVTVDGHVYQVGDSRQPFSIQSISKAFTYGIALEDRGADAVAAKIDVEPSGEAFNSISLEPDTGRPRNPIINAGAIVATSLVEGDGAESKITRILEKFAQFAGGSLAVDESIYQSEKSTGHRNRAIAHLLRNYEILEGDPEEPLDAYFRQCSILVTARDLALMGATLANDGVNPITGIRALDSTLIPRVLSAMATCGMYDYSGNWIYKVGMPAKSGVGGGIVSVLPGQLGLAVFSPRLDLKGNSVRGIAVCEVLSNDFGLHMLRTTRTTIASVIRARYTGAAVRAKVTRDSASNRFLGEAGDRILVLELIGELAFVSAEIVAVNTAEQMEARSVFIVDMTRVTSVDRSASSLLAALFDTLGRDGKTVLVTGAKHHYHFIKHLKAHYRDSGSMPICDYADVDSALEHAEDYLLREAGLAPDPTEAVPLEAQPLCRGFQAEELELLQSLLREEHFEAGQLICREGQPAEEIYFLTQGRVSVWIAIDHNRRRRMRTFAAGASFGEAALFEGYNRTADLIADVPTTALSFRPKALREMSGPLATRVLMGLLSNLSQLSFIWLASLNREIRMLAS